MDANLTAVIPQNAAAERAADDMSRGPLARMAALPPRAKLMIGAGVAGVLAVLVSLALWSQTSNLAPLYPNGMPDKEAAPVLDQLRQMGVNSKVLDGGVIMVQADRVAELRMKLSQAGLPKVTTSGYALMDNAKFGQSQLQERTQLQRALSEEVGKSIQQLASVDSARVILAMPAQNGFYREQQKPSASVVVTLRSGHTLDRAQIAGIVHLVSSSVPDLSPKAVTVLDQNGTPLAGPQESAQQSLDTQQLQYVQQVENTHLKRVLDILEPALGRDNLRATVTAEIDFTQQESTSEAYKPNQQGEATLRSQRTAEQGNAAQAQPSGVPGAASNQPGATATAPITGASAPLQGAQVGSTGGGVRRENVVNYEVDKTVSVKRNATGTIKRLNAAVLVNHRTGTDPKGKSTSTPLPQEELDKITALVQEAVGFNKDRGDSVKVVNIPFRAEPTTKPEEVPFWKQPWLLDLVRAGAVPMSLMVVAMLLVFAVIRPALKRTEPSPAELEAIEHDSRGGQLHSVVDDPQRLPSPEETLALEADNAAKQAAKQLEDARGLARQNPQAVSNILRGWMSGEPA